MEKAATYDLVFLEVISPWDWFCLDVGEDDVLDGIGIFERLLVGFLLPKIMRFLYLMVFTWYLVKMAIKSSSQSFQWKLGNRWRGFLGCDLLGKLQIVLGKVWRAQSEFPEFCCHLLLLRKGNWYKEGYLCRMNNDGVIYSCWWSLLRRYPDWEVDLNKGWDYSTRVI